MGRQPASLRGLHGRVWALGTSARISAGVAVDRSMRLLPGPPSPAHNMFNIEGALPEARSPPRLLLLPRVPYVQAVRKGLMW